ncbi:cysteine-rich CWC family protein [Cytobacillus depressus]|uniref:Cysteine-rich CWC family protein n=1 Tax=Cytobacillus depressus TaxID=1602942 RepID=A0A6L3V1R9_9BACI|nr:cysteine-rich CWC family protein [Cytobacillus depressus]KAB2332094.1 cysteine-rich CWC family protein [Cytobacillus depressus]
MTNKYCPICGEENKCMTNGSEQGQCWCNEEKFPVGIFDLVPEESRRKHCICKNCLNKYKEEQNNSQQ